MDQCRCDLLFPPNPPSCAKRGANGPTWSDNDFVDRSLYVPAINPDSEPDPEPLPSLLVGLSMPRLAGQTSLYAAVPRRDWLFASLER